MHAAVQNIAVAVRADDGTGVDADAIADLSARINRDVRKQIHFLAELRIIADKISGLQNGTRADFHALADDAVRPDVRCRVNVRGCRDDSGRMNSGGKFVFGKKQRENFRECDPRVRNLNQDFFCGRKSFVGDDRGRGAFFCAGEIIFIFGEGEVAGLRGFGGRETFQDGVAVADGVALEIFCYFSDSWHFSIWAAGR